MDKETYLANREHLKNSIKELEELKNEIRDQYIEECRPCNPGDMIEITKQSGNKVTGVAKTFRILQDQNVYVDSIDVGKTTKVYFSQPYKSLRILN